MIMRASEINAAAGTSLGTVSPIFLATDPSLFTNLSFTEPNLMSLQFSAQSTRKDNTNPKINNTKSTKKNKLLKTGMSYFGRANQ